MNQAMFLTPIKEIVSSSLMYDVDVECEALHWMLETSMYTGVILWSAKYAFSMKADQIPKTRLLLVFFLLKSLLFWISHKITMKNP